MADLKLLQPQRLTDYDDGGGLATGTEVADGQVNNLFDNITRLDRVNGGFSLRKAFVKSITADTTRYAGVHCIVQAPPADPNVSVTLFETDVWGDERSDAEAAVERYLDVSVISRMIPYDKQLGGQRTVLAFQRPDQPLPSIGEVYALSIDATETYEFFRILDLAKDLETFTDTNGDFQVAVLTLTISQPLSQDFVGSQPNRYFTAADGAAVVRKTIAADAARYYGVTTLAADAAIGDTTIKVTSVYTQLIPAALDEIPITNASPGSSGVPIAAANANQTFTKNMSNPPAIYVPTPIVPGTLSLNRDGSSWNRRDDGLGNILDLDNDNNIIGTVSYVGGLVTPINSGARWGANSISANYMPGGIVGKSALSTQTVVTSGNRGYVYVIELNPLPAPGSVALSYRALGSWIELVDDGQGALRGQTGEGVGAIEYNTGTVTATLGALPDLSSSLITTWNAPSTTEILAGDVSILVPAISFTLEGGNCEPGTLTITWLAGVTTKTATDNGSGIFTGDATGTIIYATGDVLLRPTVLPNSNAVFNCAYESGAILQETYHPSIVAGAVTITVAEPQIQPGSIKLSYEGSVDLQFGQFPQTHVLTDDGIGGLKDATGAAVAGATVNYVTGDISFAPSFDTSAPGSVYSLFDLMLPSLAAGLSGAYDVNSTPGKWAAEMANITATMAFTGGAAMIVWYKQSTTTNASLTEGQTAPPLVVDLTPLVSDAIVPGSLLFGLGGDVYYDHSGSLYRAFDPHSGAGTLAGTIDYTSGVATITNYTGDVAPAFSVASCLGQIGQLPLASVAGRTPGSPLRPGTFYVQANRYSDGMLISGLADDDGNVTTADMHGVVDVTNGVFNVAFGAYVLDSSLTTDQKAQPWYDAANVDGTGHIWFPAEIIPGSMTFNCVVQTALPLNVGLIKVNPVRLPVDGRVQSIRDGDTLVLHDELIDTMPNPLSAGQVVTISRGGTMSVWAYDTNGMGVDDALYTFDPTANTVTWANPLDLSAYTQPLKVIHSIEDMALVTDVQITGDLQIGAPLTHNYTAGHSLASSALILNEDGNAQARYSYLFAQNTWTNAWSDTVIGSGPISGAAYNDSSYPIVLLNRDCVKERFALIFTSSTAFNIVGEELGVIGTGTTASDCAPLNPATGNPYFTMHAAGFGSGWAIGNVIRFDTYAAGGPIWAARTILPGPVTDASDLTRVQTRWDA